MKKTEKYIIELFTTKGESALLDLKYIPNVDLDFIIHTMHKLSLPLPIKLLEDTWSPSYGPSDIIGHGWGNGYVKLVEGHSWYGMDYENIPVSIHGGLTFSRLLDNENNNKGFDSGFWIGFDTSHFGDNLSEWPEYKVWDETVCLFTQCYLSQELDLVEGRGN